jgi:hypothetical protein
MARYLSTIPTNIGFYNLGSVWSYPTGGTGPTAYGPNGYFGSDPLPATGGDSINNPVDLGDFTSQFRSLTIKNDHGGLSRKQSIFYRIKLNKARSVQFTQDYSQFAYTQETNRNTLLAFYKVVDGNHRVELPINNSGYVYSATGVDYDSEDYTSEDYPNLSLDPGEYIFLITNDIRYQETQYSISLNVAILDWRFVYESPEDFGDFGLISDGPATSSLDFGTLAD